jgi:hypothetical protein
MPQQQELESLPSAQAQAWVPRASPQQELEWAQEKKRRFLFRYAETRQQVNDGLGLDL